MNKNKYIWIFLALILSGSVFFMGYAKYSNPEELYHVYLSGKTIGYVSSKEELDSYIDKQEEQIKVKYNVDRVYAPKNLNVVKETTYNKKVSSVETIYKNIKKVAPFTVSGFTITIKGIEDTDDEGKYKTDDVVVNVLDKNVFTDALMEASMVFLDKEKYNDYINKNQKEITDTGTIINNVLIENDIISRQNKISVDDEIFINSELLSKYLLFGTLETQKTYKVKEGDTIEQVAYDNKLSVEEFLIVNEEFSSEDNLLYPGEIVSLGVVKPAFKLIEESFVVETETVKYKTEIVYDDSLLVGVEKIKQKGSNGTSKVSKEITKKNGEIITAEVVSSSVVKPPVNKVIVRGKGTISTGSLGTWAWPTNIPYVITSKWGWRWGKFHEGVDISGTGHGSPIYAANDGIVEASRYHSINGNYIVINHNNGYYTIYAHLAKLSVKEGEIVSIGQKIGTMGSTGLSTGPHLHFGIYKGYPLRGGTTMNPLRFY